MLLHGFDLQLGWHVGYELHRIVRAGGDESRLQAMLDPAIAAFARATAGSGYHLWGPELLLSQFDLRHIAWAVALDRSDRPWHSYGQVLECWADCLSEINSGLGMDTSRRWWATSEELENRLHDGDLRFLQAIDLISEWVDELRRFLRGLGRIDLVPKPDGFFPTPRNPTPAARADHTVDPDCPKPAPARAELEPQRQREPDQADSASPYLDATEAAALLRTSVKSLYGLVERGAINPLRGPRRRYRFTPEMIAEYLKRERGD